MPTPTKKQYANWDATIQKMKNANHFEILKMFKKVGESSDVEKIAYIHSKTSREILDATDFQHMLKEKYQQDGGWEYEKIFTEYQKDKLTVETNYAIGDLILYKDKVELICGFNKYQIKTELGSIYYHDYENIKKLSE